MFDIRDYFAKIREEESKIKGQFAVVVSMPTPDGGKAGAVSEVPRGVAAKMIAGRRARLATAEEVESYHAQCEQALAEAERAATAGKVQIAVMSDSEIRALRSTMRPQKG